MGDIVAFQPKNPAMITRKQVADTLLACRAMGDTVTYTAKTVAYILESYAIAMNLLLGARGWLPEVSRLKVEAALRSAEWLESETPTPEANV
jgi:hypothetical protein